MRLPPRKILLAAAGSALLLGYAGGFLSQILSGYAAWRESGGIPGSGTSPPLPSLSPVACLQGLLDLPYGVYGLLLCGGAVALLVLYRKLSAGNGEYDADRNFAYAPSGTYGTSGWMTRQELGGVLELVHDLRGHTGTILGMLGSEIVCVPEKSRLNRNIAVYGVSGSMKTRSYCLNRILQGVAAGESLVINDPKSELYETTSEYLAAKGYIVRVFNLVNPECSDAWNCLEEVDGQELNAQLFVDVVIKNTQGNSKGDRFWDIAEVQAPYGFVLTDQTYTVTFGWNDQSNDVVLAQTIVDHTQDGDEVYSYDIVNVSNATEDELDDLPGTIQFENARVLPVVEEGRIGVGVYKLDRDSADMADHQPYLDGIKTDPALLAAGSNRDRIPEGAILVPGATYEL